MNCETIPVDVQEIASAAAHFVVAYERLGFALEALERATGIKFAKAVEDEIRIVRQEQSHDH